MLLCYVIKYNVERCNIYIYIYNIYNNIFQISRKGNFITKNQEK